MADNMNIGPTIGQVQTDTFCDGCGYNLHTQAVMRDTRLGILVCRCPECGRFAAAGQVTSAARIWLSRLATLLLAWWVLFLVILFGLCAFFLGMLAYGHMMEQTTWVSDVAPTTQPMYYNSYYHSHYVIAPAASDPIIASDHSREMALFVLGTVLLGLLTGGFFAVLLWHVRGWRRVFAYLPALLGCGISAWGWSVDRQSIHIRPWGFGQIGEFVVIDLFAVTAGLWIGRPFARGLLTLLVPPKARQHLAFLWICDGKVPATTSHAKHQPNAAPRPEPVATLAE